MASDPNSADLALLDLWKTVQADIKHSPSGMYYVVTNSIPTALIEAIGTSSLTAKCIEMDGLQCLSLAYWRALCEKLCDEISNRMRLRSLKLAMLGEGPDDLDHAPTLSNWIAVRDTQFGGAMLIATPTNHPTLQSTLIHTSRLCGIAADQTWARTTSRWYSLETPAEATDLSEWFGLCGVQMALQPWQIQAIIAEDQEEEGFR